MNNIRQRFQEVRHEREARQRKWFGQGGDFVTAVGWVALSAICAWAVRAAAGIDPDAPYFRERALVAAVVAIAVMVGVAYLAMRNQLLRSFVPRLALLIWALLLWWQYRQLAGG